MSFSLTRPVPPPASSTGFTIRGSLVLYGRAVPQVQYLTDRYVVTQVDRGMFIYLVDRAERFLVDRGASRLRRIEPNVQRIRVDRLRAVVGDIRVEADAEPVEVGGYTCTRYRFSNSTARIVIAGEALVTSVDGIETTALQAEREHDARDQPFSLPLEANQIVVESKLRTIAVEFEQNQCYRLETVEAAIAEPGSYDRIARLAIID